jgi:hypothetical protein
MENPCSPFVRSLSAWEVQEARIVFGNGLNYDHIRIHECVNWTNLIDRLGAWIKRIDYSGRPNAITLGNHCHFGGALFGSATTDPQLEHDHMPWLIHELTHTWQYQRLGWRYLPMALWSQMRHGGTVYDYHGHEGLRDASAKGLRLASFNLEQQGDITRDYYRRVQKNLEVQDWEPYIEEIRQRA